MTCTSRFSMASNEASHRERTMHRDHGVVRPLGGSTLLRAAGAGNRWPKALTADRLEAVAVVRSGRLRCRLSATSHRSWGWVSAMI